MECFITAFDLQIKGIDHEIESAESEHKNFDVENPPKTYQSSGITEMESYFKELLSAVETFVENSLSRYFLERRNATEWNEELQVIIC